MSDVHAAFQSSENGELINENAKLIKRLTDVVETQSAVIVRLEQLMEAMKVDFDDLKNYAKNTRKLLLEGDIHLKTYLSGEGEVPHSWACAYHNLKWETFKALPGVEYHKHSHQKFMVKVSSLRQTAYENWVEDGYDILGEDFKKIPSHKRKDHFIQYGIKFNLKGDFVDGHLDYMEELRSR